MPGVFISYRREDSPGHAGRNLDRLRAHFGPDVVFMDVHAVAGIDFVAEIERAVGSSGRCSQSSARGMATADGAGQRRLDNPRDFVRLEIGGALKRGIPVVPVLVDEARLPGPGDLPDEFEPLVRRNAVVLRDSRWDADFEDLARSVQRLIQAQAPQQRDAAGQVQPAGAGANQSWARAAVVGLVVIAAGFAAATRECAPNQDETKAESTTAATPSAVPQAVVSRPDPPAEAASSGMRDRAVASRSAGPATRDTRPVPARRGRLGIAWLGVWLDTITSNPRGVIVGDVARGGPAARAGIEVDDVLIEVAGRAVASFTRIDVENAVVGHVNNEPPDTPTTVHVVHDGKHLALPIVSIGRSVFGADASRICLRFAPL